MSPLRERLRERPESVLLFVGSGLSIPPTPLPRSERLPSWSEMLGELCRELRDPRIAESLEKAIGSRKLINAASTIAKQLGRERISRYIEETFFDPRFTRPAAYEAVAALPCSHFVTTNYDPWLRKALRERAPSGRTVVEDATPDQTARLRTYLDRDSAFVFSAHYDARDAARCVFTQDEYRMLLHGTPGYLDILSALFTTHAVLFLGYSIGDPDLEYVLAHVQTLAGRGSATRHWLLDVGIDPVDEDRLLDLGVQPIDYDGPDKFRLLEPLLRSLAPAPAAASSRVASAARAAESSAQARLVECPYPGLEAFQKDQSRFYFGREAEVLTALQRIRAPEIGKVPWLQIEGASGAGKSSLARAGLLPKLELEAGGNGSRRWTIGVLRPGRSALRNLAFALHECLGDSALSTELIESELRAEPGRITSVLRERLPAGRKLFLLIDQLEEAFTASGPEQTTSEAELRLFAECLAAALLDPSERLQLVTTVRRDFQGQFTRVPALDALLNRAERFNLPPLDEAALRLVIEEPARLAGLEWSDADLPARIARDAAEQQNALPLLAYCLKRLWELRDGRVLLARAYDVELRGVGHALARGADELLARLEQRVAGERTWKALALELLGALVHTGRGTGDTRRRLAKHEAIQRAGGGSVGNEIFEALAGGTPASWPGWAPAPRLVVDPGEGQSVEGAEILVELAHESLISDWPLLREHITHRREDYEWRDRLEEAALLWETHGRPEETGVSEWTRERFAQTAELSRASAVRPFLEAVKRERRAKVTDDEVGAIFQLREDPYFLAFADRLAEGFADGFRNLEPADFMLGVIDGVHDWFEDELQRFRLRCEELRARPVQQGMFWQREQNSRWQLERAEEVRRRMEASQGSVARLLTAAKQHIPVVAAEIHAHRSELERGWQEVLASVRGCRAHPRYANAPLEPRYDLLPLRIRPSAVPEGRTWEFLRLGTGKRPELVKETQAWAVDGASGLVVVLAPPGSFTMGAEEELDATPHVVELAPYYVGAHTCTRGAWERLRGGAAAQQAALPAVEMDWDQALAACAALGGRLPTEAEWEYACRAETTNRYWSGDEEADLERVGWYQENAEARSHAVGKKPANLWGLHDAHGNVWEWCQDWYGPYSEGRPSNPRGPRSGFDRVVRGGSCRVDAVWCGSAYRNWRHPTSRFDNIGFRVAFPAAPELGR